MKPSVVSNYKFQVNNIFWEYLETAEKDKVFSVNHNKIDLEDELCSEYGDVFVLYLMSQFLYIHGVFDAAAGAMVKMKKKYCGERDSLVLFQCENNTILEMKAFEYYNQLSIVYAAVGEMNEASEYRVSAEMANLKPINHFTQNVNTEVYLFRGLTADYDFKSLENNTITVISPKLMNDSWDSLVYDWNLAQRQKVEVMAKRIPGCTQDIIDSFMAPFYVSEQVDSHYRIRSFVDGKMDPRKMNLMWAHYANNAKGICIKYSLSPYFQHFIQGAYANVMSAVQYCDEYDYTKSSHINLIDSFFKKEEVWKYENEVRLLNFDSSTDKDYINIELDEDSCIKEVYFGLNCSEENIDKVLDALKSKTGIKYYIMSKNSYKSYTKDTTQLKMFVSNDEEDFVKKFFEE